MCSAYTVLRANVRNTVSLAPVLEIFNSRHPPTHTDINRRKCNVQICITSAMYSYTATVHMTFNPYTSHM